MHLRPFLEPALTPAFDALYRRVQSRLAAANFEESGDLQAEGNPEQMKTPSPYNLDTALNLHSGALSVVIESPSHAASTATRAGKPVVFTPDDLVDIQLLCHQEAMKFLAETGGRSKWLPPPKK